MRFHLPALPGQPITKANSTCAFTQKVRKFADMMVPRGHEVNVYGDPQHDSLGDHVACYPETAPPAFSPEAWEEYNRTGSTQDLAPFWRAVDASSPMAKKLSFDSAWIDLQRELEA